MIQGWSVCEYHDEDHNGDDDTDANDDDHGGDDGG